MMRVMTKTARVVIQLRVVDPVLHAVMCLFSAR